MLFAQTPQSDVSWLSWLPSFFQQPAAIFTIFVGFAAFGLAKSFPKSDKSPWLPEAASIVAGVACSCGLKIGDSYVYATGFGVISAWGASSFYNLGFTWLTARLRSITGQPAPPDAVKMVDVNNLPAVKPEGKL